jgi:hypothetical protein
MHTLALAGGHTIDGVPLLGIPAEHSAKRQLSGSADEVVRSIATVLDQMIMGVIQKRTAEEFKDAYMQVFGHYMQLVCGLSSVISSIVPKNVVVRLTYESFCELEADIREHAVSAFGSDMRDRAVFTVWTLRKISDLLQVAWESKIQDEDREKDEEFLSFFMAHALRARFGIDCLVASMRSQRTISPEAMPLLADILRSAVDAYAWIKQADELRNPSDEEEDVIQPDWADEDDELLSESMQDIAYENA